MGSQFDAGQPIIDRVRRINYLGYGCLGIGYLVKYQCYNNVPDHLVPYVSNPI